MIFFPSLLVVFLIIKLTLGYNDFPSLLTANATMAVIIEEDFFDDLKVHQKTLSEISGIISSVIKRNMQISGIEFVIFGHSNINIVRDYTVLLSVATCQSTWRLNKAAGKEDLVHLAITDPDCPRIPKDSGVGLPLIIPGQELSQIFFDLRMSSIFKWTKVNFIHDDTFARDTISRLVKALSMELPDERIILSTRALFLTMFDKNDVIMRQRIHKVLSDFQVDYLGRNFMVIVTIDMVSSILGVAKSLNMLNPKSQWLFIISESSGRETNFTSLIELLDEGENVAFLRNATNFRLDCNMGLVCHVKEMVEALAKSLESSLLSEMELYDHVTDEEFEVVRLSKDERKAEIIKSINV